MQDLNLLVFPGRKARPGLARSASALAESDEPFPDSLPIVLELLDAWRGRQHGHPSRNEAIETLITRGWPPETRAWIVETELS
jgi:hypothetical protein